MIVGEKFVFIHIVLLIIPNEEGRCRWIVSLRLIFFFFFIQEIGTYIIEKRRVTEIQKAVNLGKACYKHIMS